jgi:hypothetical protein
VGSTVLLGRRGHGCRGDEYSFLGVWVVPKFGTERGEGLPVFADVHPEATNIAIVGKPWMEESGELGLHGANHREQSEAIQEHGEGTPLGNAGLAEKGNELIARAMDNQESVVFVTVEGKQGTHHWAIRDGLPRAWRCDRDC